MNSVDFEGKMRYNCSYPHIQTDGVLETPTARSNQRKGKFRMATSDSTSNIPYGYCRCGCGQKTPLYRDSNAKRGIVKGEPCLYVYGHNMKKTISDAFWPKVAKTENPEECWEWQTYKNKKGYGIIMRRENGKYRQHYAHRVSWELAHGKIPEGMVICHRCDNPACVNPSHLFLGTREDNNKDKQQKGREPNGEQKPNHKLTVEQVKYIREKYAMGGVTYKQLAIESGVCTNTVRSAIKRLRWQSVE